MIRFLAQFPFSHDPRHFAATLAAATLVVAAAVGLGTRYAPIPRIAGPLPAGALLTLAVPAERPLSSASAALGHQFPQESEALRRFAESRPELAAALVDQGTAALTLFPTAASGTARFMLELPTPSPQGAVLTALARTAPVGRTLQLPDNSAAEELIEDPTAVAARLERVAGTDWLVLPVSEQDVAFRSDEQSFVFLSFSPQDIVNHGSVWASRGACLEGFPIILPGKLPPRWSVVHVLPFPVPVLLPRASSSLMLDGVPIFLKNFCNSPGK